jgi:hypothetical protein
MHGTKSPAADRVVPRVVQAEEVSASLAEDAAALGALLGETVVLRQWRKSL